MTKSAPRRRNRARGYKQEGNDASGESGIHGCRTIDFARGRHHCRRREPMTQRHGLSYVSSSAGRLPDRYGSVMRTRTQHRWSVPKFRSASRPASRQRRCLSRTSPNQADLVCFTPHEARRTSSSLNRSRGAFGAVAWDPNGALTQRYLSSRFRRAGYGCEPTCK